MGCWNMLGGGASGPQLFARTRQVDGRLLVTVVCVDVGATIDQQRAAVGVPILRREHERRISGRLVSCPQQRSALLIAQFGSVEQSLHAVGPPILRVREQSCSERPRAQLRRPLLGERARKRARQWRLTSRRPRMRMGWQPLQHRRRRPGGVELAIRPAVHTAHADFASQLRAHADVEGSTPPARSIIGAEPPPCGPRVSKWQLCGAK